MRARGGGKRGRNPAAASRGVAAEVTHQGIVGSPAYMAPEQWLDARKADARTDQYALGATCFQVLRGELPFAGGTLIQIARQHASTAVPSLGDSQPQALHTVVSRAMAKRASERYADLLELASAFRDALGLPAETEALPHLGEALRDTLALTAPQPIAESVTALEAAHDVAQATKSAELLLEVTAQYVALVALAGLMHMPQGARPTSELLARRLSQLGSERLDATGWLDIACEIAAGFRDEPTRFPLPELVASLADPGFVRPTGGALAQLVADVERMFGKLTWICDYRVASIRRRVLEGWSGTRRSQRAIGAAPKDAQDGAVVLLDGNGHPAMTLSPLFQVARPSPGMAEDLFSFDGTDKRGPRLRAQPFGFDRHDPDLSEAFRAAGLEIGVVAGAEAAAEQPPYRGLSTFTRDDAGWFFGREREIEGFANRLRVTALLAVVGPSGAGKSSFVQAGVLPSLPEGTRAITVRPGATPIAELVARLARAGIAIDRERLLAEPQILADKLREQTNMFVLVVDQFEELLHARRGPRRAPRVQRSSHAGRQRRRGARAGDPHPA